MSKESKLAKVASLVCMFAGVFVVGACVYLLVVGDTSIGSVGGALDGAVAILSGVRSARLANVPSNATKVRSSGLLVAAVSGIDVAACLVGHAALLATACCVVLCLIGLVLALAAHRLAHLLEQV